MTSNNEGAKKQEQEAEEGTFEFRLFASVTRSSKSNQNEQIGETNLVATQEQKSPSAKPKVQRIRLNSPQVDDPHNSTGARSAAIPRRPHSYYFASPPTALQQAQYAEAAITGEQVQKISQQPRPGFHLPWRVILWPASAFKAVAENGNVRRRSTSTIAAAPEERLKKKRSRLGKKSRLKIRRNFQAAREKEDAAKAEQQAKEDALKEKNRQMNRKRQLRRREKAREKKLDSVVAEQ